MGILDDYINEIECSYNSLSENCYHLMYQVIHLIQNVVYLFLYIQLLNPNQSKFSIVIFSSIYIQIDILDEYTDEIECSYKYLSENQYQYIH